MSYKVNNILYAAGGDILNTICVAITFSEAVNCDMLTEAAEQAVKRFPYFSVKLERRGEEYVLEHNIKPLPVIKGKSFPAIGSAETDYHLAALNYEGNTVYINTTHFITDGNGLFPFIRTLVYLYLHALHPGEIFNTDSIALPGSEIPAEEEEDDPYPSVLLPEEPIVTAKLPEKILRLDDLYNARGDRAGHTSFRLSIKQKELMNYISMVDGSPATFIASVMYKAIVQLHPDSHLPVVCGMQHQFRKALRKPYSHMCHVNIVPMILPERLRDKDIETINTMLRGMLILRASDENDILTINEHIRNELRIKDMTLEEKHRCMRNVLLDGIGENTFEVSYTGRVPWCGTDKYIENVSPYLDIALSGGLSIEIFSVRDRFDINIMQSTADTRYFDRFCKLLTSYSIGYTAEGASHYEICGHILP